MPTKQVPFFANTPDDTHYVQAVFKMALKYFLPNKDFSWKQLDEMTQKQTGKGTWWFPAVARLNQMGLETTYIEKFDYAQYYAQGDDYMRAFYGHEIGDWFLRNSNIAKVKKLIPEFLASRHVETRAAMLHDINDFLNQGWLVGAEINVRVLQNQSGFNGHMILIHSRQDNNYIVHDPGLPAVANRVIDRGTFKRAWAYSGPDKTALIAFKCL
jgi:hypothetical protein